MISTLAAKYFSTPMKLEYCYCEDFISSVPIFMDNFRLYFHQIYHVDVGSRLHDSRYYYLNSDTIKIALIDISQHLCQLKDAEQYMKQEFEKVSHLLLHFRNVLKPVAGSTATLLKDLHYLDGITNFEDYMKAFNDCFKAINKDVEKNEKGVLVRKMIGLIKDSCMNQLYLETMLELPCKVAYQLLKQRLQGIVGLGSLNKNTFIKYVTMMEKPEFIKTTLMEEVNLIEFFEVVKVLLNQANIIGQIKESKAYFSQFDKYVFTTDEFSSIYFSWKNNLIQISEIETNPQYLRELEQMKHFYFFDQTSNSIFELSKFTKKLWEYQQKLVMYHSFVNHFSNFRRDVQKVCIKNFNVVVNITFKPN